jgi:hypothetical protein
MFPKLALGFLPVIPVPGKTHKNKKQHRKNAACQYYHIKFVNCFDHYSLPALHLSPLPRQPITVFTVNREPSL